MRKHGLVRRGACVEPRAGVIVKRERTSDVPSGWSNPSW